MSLKYQVSIVKTKKFDFFSKISKFWQIVVPSIFKIGLPHDKGFIAKEYTICNEIISEV